MAHVDTRRTPCHVGLLHVLKQWNMFCLASVCDTSERWKAFVKLVLR